MQIAITATTDSDRGGDVSESEIDWTRIDWARIDWDLLGRYQGGMCTPEEGQQVAQWLAESPDHWSLLRALPVIATIGDRALPPEHKAAFTAALRRRQALAESPADPAPQLDVIRGNAGRAPRFAARLPPRKLAVTRAAAAMILLGAGLLAGRALLRSPVAPMTIQPAAHVIATARGERLSRRLPDGTRVMLAPASTLRIATTYGVTDRAVWLDGEAVFTVVHDSTRPFAVHTARGVARDLGTRFLVRAYNTDPVTDVVVAEGRVAVAHAQAETLDTVVVGRGEGARITGDRLVVTRNLALGPYFAWTEGRLVFRKTPLRDAVIQLSRWYDIDVHLTTAELGDQLLTATLESEPAPEALALIATTFKLRLSHDGRNYTLSPK